MKKIKTLFKRDLTKQPTLVYNEVNDGCEWVVIGEGIATRKYDGQCCAIINGTFYRRRELKSGQNIPENFKQEDFDEVTGKTVGWIPVTENSEDKYFMDAFNLLENKKDGTYELLGQGSQGDIEKVGKSILRKHSDSEIYNDCPRNFEALKKWLSDKDIEGIVWHHSDGRMVKIKKKDFGLKR